MDSASPLAPSRASPTWIRRLLVSVVGLGAAAAIGACNSPDGKCKDDYGCDGTTVCRVSSGTCEPFACNTNSDCAEGQTCSDNSCH